MAVSVPLHVYFSVCSVLHFSVCFILPISFCKWPSLQSITLYSIIFCIDNSIQKNRTKRIRYNEIAESVSSSIHHQYCIVSTKEYVLSNRVIKLNNNMTIYWHTAYIDFMSMFYPFLEPLCVVQQVPEHFEILWDIHQYYW